MFAAKMWLALFTICTDPRELNENEEWGRFREREWMNYGFIDEILKEYHRKWKSFSRQQMDFEE